MLRILSVMAAGYSSRTLIQKLGIKPHTRIAVMGAPRGYRSILGPLPPGVTATDTLRGTLPFIHFFTKQRAALESRFPMLERALTIDGALWISWPKQSSGVVTDLTESGVRAVALGHGLVDVKVCAVDETWSGLKLVRRLADRTRSRS